MEKLARYQIVLLLVVLSVPITTTVSRIPLDLENQTVFVMTISASVPKTFATDTAFARLNAIPTD